MTSDQNGAPAPPPETPEPAAIVVAPGPNSIDPRDRVEDVRKMLPPRRPLVVRDRTIADEGTAYHVIRWRPDLTPGSLLSIAKSKRFQIAGDHLFVAEVNGALPIYVRLGPTSNPLIRIRRGMTLRRSFSQLQLFLADPLEQGFFTAPAIHPEVTLYASTGPFMEDAPEIDGIDASMRCRSDRVITTAAQFIHRIMNLNPVTTGKIGGILMVQNLSTATDIYIMGAFGDGVTYAGNAANGFVIRPGAIFTAKLAGRLGGNFWPFNGTESGISLVTQAGSAPCSILISPGEMDQFDAALGPETGSMA